MCAGMNEHEARLCALTRQLAGRAHDYERGAEWPQASLDAYAEIGGFGWGLPETFSGANMPTKQKAGPEQTATRHVQQMVCRKSDPTG